MTALNYCCFQLLPEDNQALYSLCGCNEEHLSQLEENLGVKIYSVGFDFKLIGTKKRLSRSKDFIVKLYKHGTTESLNPHKINLMLLGIKNRNMEELVIPEQRFIKLRRKQFKTINSSQNSYVQAIENYDVSFGIGPAGTGKTYLAVACAVSELENEKVSRIILTRPALEAGESLGFLPGGLEQKIDPYLRPLFDALFDMLGVEKVGRLIEKQIIEIAPLAFMRGRTLKDSFILLDEAQNTTIEQMKMFLTRIGFGSKAVITGDITQCDLPKHKKSGLKHALAVLKDVPEIKFNFFKNHDVVRHGLVQKIVQAYEDFDKRQTDKDKK